MDLDIPAWKRGGALCGGCPELLGTWTMEGRRWPVVCLGYIVFGGGVYGLTLGLWRGVEQGIYTAIKFPLLLVLVATGNALLNALIALGFGARLGMRQSFMTVWMSFAIMALILGSLSPVFLFILWNLPEQGATGSAHTYLWLVLCHVAAIAVAGLAANMRLYVLLNHLVQSRVLARTILLCWLAGNALLGTQLSWNLRPFFGSPDMTVEFFRSDAFDRNFFEGLHAIFIQLTD